MGIYHPDTESRTIINDEIIKPDPVNEYKDFAGRDSPIWIEGIERIKLLHTSRRLTYRDIQGCKLFRKLMMPLCEVAKLKTSCREGYP